jgi:hypothetical protein
MGFEVFRDDKNNKTGFAVFSRAPSNNSLATGMAGNTITKAAPLTAPVKTSIADFRRLDQASEGPTKPYSPAKTVGDDIFLVNALPIKQTDPIPKKIGKGAVNTVFSLLEAPTESLRHVSILGGDVLTGKGVQPIPKNTSFVGDILPSSLSKPIRDFSAKHPFLGTGVQMGLEALSDPTIMMGVGGAKTMLSPEALTPGRLGAARNAVELPESFDYLNEIAETVPRRTADFSADALGNIRRGEPLEALPGRAERLALPPGRQPLALPSPAPKPQYAPWVREDLIEQFNNMPKTLTKERDPFVGMRENLNKPFYAIGNTIGDVRFKRAPDQDLSLLRDAMTKRVGPLRIGKVDLAPEAFEKPDFQAAQTIADKLGLRLVAFKGTGHRGMQQGRTIYLNKNMKDPLDYVFWHEVGHTMEVTHPQHYDNLMGIALEHMKDTEGLTKHYKDFGYAMEDMPHEFAADVFAEALNTPGFFARVAEKAPEMLKPLLEAIDSLIANIRAMVSKDDTVLPYLRDLETLRNRIHTEVADPYFRDAMGEKQFVDTFGKRWQDSAAKAKGDIRFKLNRSSPLDDLKSIVQYGAEIVRGGRASFEKAIRQQFGNILEGYSPEVQTRLLNDLWLHSKQLAEKGQTTIKMGSESLPVTRIKGGKTVSPAGKHTAPAQGQIRGNAVAFPQVDTLPRATGKNLADLPFSSRMPQVAGTEERGVSRNIRTDTARPDELRDAVSENPMMYDQLANKETLSKAQAIYADGLEPAVTRLNDLLQDMKPEAAPLAKMIADDLAKMGQVDRAREILSNAAVRATEAGQFGQAFRILREADPQTFLMTMDKQLRKLNEQGRELYGKQWKDIDLTDAEKEAISQLQKGDQQAYDDLMNAIGERIANIMPSTALEKFDSWRRMAMLLNPKTHIRNVAGNAIMMGLRKSADSLAAGLESAFLKPGQRTKAVGWSKDKNLADIVNRDWEAIAKDFTGEKVTLKNLTSNLPSQGRWEIDNMRALNREKRIFQNDLLEKANNLSRNTLNAEDRFFKERAYKDALGGYLKANKLTEVTDAAREYAKRRALEATYQDANMVATWISKVKSSGGIGGKLVEAAIPFAKTPTNLVKRAVEYSPAGILRLLSSQNQTPAMAIEVLAQGLTGTAVAGLGYLLANMGWIRAERSTSKNAEGLLNEAGDQPYSFVTPIGSYTFDWAQPIAVPLFMGVALYESLMKQDKIDPDSVAESIAAGGDTVFNLSMLKNIKQLLGGGFGSVTEQIAGLPVSYIEQAYPTVFGQVARTVDDTKRSTYDTTGTGRFGRQLAAKTPFASKSLEPKLDIWGNEQKQGGAAQQFLSPGFALPKSNDRTTQEMVRLYRATKETDMLPKLFKGSFTVSGEKVQLTPKQLTAFQRDMGQANYQKISEVISTDRYQNASDDEKVKMIRKIVQGNYDDTKQEYLDKLGIESDKSESMSW